MATIYEKSILLRLTNKQYKKLDKVTQRLKKRQEVRGREDVIRKLIDKNL